MWRRQCALAPLKEALENKASELLHISQHVLWGKRLSSGIGQRTRTGRPAPDGLALATNPPISVLGLQIITGDGARLKLLAEGCVQISESLPIRRVGDEDECGMRRSARYP